MSICPHIRSLVQAKKLHPYKPLPGPRRCLFLTDEAMRDLEQGLVRLLALRGVVEEGLKRWVYNGRVWVDLEGKPRFLKPLCPPPDGIWEIRFTDPRVQVRLFGRFAKPDTVIGTKFHTRQMLGRKGSRDWQSAMSNCESRWQELFPSFKPFIGKTIHEYVTENCDDFAICT